MNAEQKRIIKELWTEHHEKLLNKELEANDELRKLFEKHPEKKDEYKFKILDSEGGGGGRSLTIQQCKTCMFCLKREPFGRLPEHSNCMIYEDGKPEEVFHDGEPCEYYEKQK